MTVVAKPLFNASQAPASETPQYTAPLGVRTIIDKYTGTNVSALPATLTIKLVPSGGSPDATNTIVVKTIPAGDVYTFPEVVGHVLNPGDSISSLASTAASITQRASGREVT